MRGPVCEFIWEYWIGLILTPKWQEPRITCEKSGLKWLVFIIRLDYLCSYFECLIVSFQLYYSAVNACHLEQPTIYSTLCTFSSHNLTIGRAELHGRFSSWLCWPPGMSTPNVIGECEEGPLVPMGRGWGDMVVVSYGLVKVKKKGDMSCTHWVVAVCENIFGGESGTLS